MIKRIARRLTRKVRARRDARKKHDVRFLY